MEPPGNEAQDSPEPAEQPDPMDEIREAATAVIDSLRQLLEATEKLVADPTAFNQAVAGGKSLFEAFTSGFVDETAQSGSEPGESDEAADWL